MEDKLKNVQFLLHELTQSNINEIYQRNYKVFLIENSDEVTKNDEVVQKGTKRSLLLMTNQHLENKIKVSETINGIPITENDFIDDQINILDNVQFDDLVLKKKLELYKKHLENRDYQIKNDSIRQSEISEFHNTFKSFNSDIKEIAKEWQKFRLNENKDVLIYNNIPDVLDSFVNKLYYSYTFLLDLNKAVIKYQETNKKFDTNAIFHFYGKWTHYLNDLVNEFEYILNANILKGKNEIARELKRFMLNQIKDFFDVLFSRAFHIGIEHSIFKEDYNSLIKKIESIQILENMN